MIYNDIILNKEIFNNLTSFYKNDRVPSAFIFHGIKGVGKEAHAIEFFALMNCKNPRESFACGECNSCKKTKKLQHENLYIIMPMPRTKTLSRNDNPLKLLSKKQHEDLSVMLSNKGTNPYYNLEFKSANTILVNSIREIKKSIQYSLDDSSTRIFLILQAEKLCYPNQESANALLKILEEPPPNNLFILIASDMTQLLDTIISRCIKIHFPNLKKTVVKNYLKNKDSNNNKIESISRICNGNIKQAITLLDNYNNKINDLKIITNYLFEKHFDEIENIMHLFKNKNSSIDTLNYLNSFFRDLLVIQRSDDYDNINFYDLENLLLKINSKYNHANWEDCILLNNNTQKYINNNGNIPLMVKAFFIELKNNINNRYYNITKIDYWLNYPN